MEKKEELYEIEQRLMKNQESLTMLQKRLYEVEEEEKSYRRDIPLFEEKIDALWNVLRGQVLLEIQKEAFSMIEESRQEVEKAFCMENEYLKEELCAVERERSALLYKKQELISGDKNE